MRGRSGWVPSWDGTWLSWRAWEAEEPRGVLLVVHGLGEHAGRYGRLAAAMVPRGWSCWAADLRGMGASEGRRGHLERWSDWVRDVRRFHELVATEVPDREVVPLGHSFGGVIVTTAVLSGDLRPRRFVLSNPAFRLRDRVPLPKLLLGRVASRAVPALTLPSGLDPETLARDPAVAEAYRADPLVHDRISARLFAEWEAAAGEALRLAPRLEVPFLVLVSGGDGLVDHTGSLELDRRAACRHTLRFYPAAAHEPFNDLDAEAVFRDLTEWLEDGPDQPA
ncbi:MAG: lysophospholipase [Candidatus Dormibacteraeota bacterium]|nr:lysophospholipase [Candidatus Dormibacteraeota bacterium]MBO0762631.1 lysophospholipase [Candidatus Dormibacteraeota bacterium]